ncbi:hypothetical protein GA0074695_3401 [Micromonospora viridifaciens]|uniref:DoxX-like family protein n=1 Tax=Micromonospora viridifaciens TaxID=1881 RepID=A0A1C4XL46_MICVI|nr:hypothetical protein [Micromonospora viridifaciens]SCF09062.1 hypothetical protein GA0074695_3401 [Micromonospora viridifaciens]
MTTTVTAPSRNIALISARVIAGLLGSVQLAGAAFFLLIAPEAGVWLGLWIDVPIVALTLSAIFLKLGVAFLPGLSAARRIAMGFVAFPLGIAVTLVKITAYHEPEGVTFVVIDTVLLLLVLLARRSERR